tara:strand:- start:277 stop:471 length:195 start_codon:yes stop_codon:yes gene_type:complete
MPIEEVEDPTPAFSLELFVSGVQESEVKDGTIGGDQNDPEQPDCVTDPKDPDVGIEEEEIIILP